MEKAIKRFLFTGERIRDAWDFNGQYSGEGNGWPHATGCGTNDCNGHGEHGVNFDGAGSAPGGGFADCVGGTRHSKPGKVATRIKSYNGHEVYEIDRLSTLIYSVHGNIARGAVILPDMTIEDCYVARVGNTFAHGLTARLAFYTATSEAFRARSIGERIEYCKKACPCVDVVTPVVKLFHLHNVLTGSRYEELMEFAEGNGIDADDGVMTMREFINLVEEGCGGKAIRQLKEAYGMVKSPFHASQPKTEQ